MLTYLAALVAVLAAVIGIVGKARRDREPLDKIDWSLITTSVLTFCFAILSQLNQDKQKELDREDAYKADVENKLLLLSKADPVSEIGVTLPYQPGKSCNGPLDDVRSTPEPALTDRLFLDALVPAKLQDSTVIRSLSLTAKAGSNAIAGIRADLAPAAAASLFDIGGNIEGLTNRIVISKASCNGPGTVRIDIGLGTRFQKHGALVFRDLQPPHSLARLSIRFARIPTKSELDAIRRFVADNLPTMYISMLVDKSSSLSLSVEAQMSESKGNQMDAIEFVWTSSGVPRYYLRNR